MTARTSVGTRPSTENGDAATCSSVCREGGATKAARDSTSRGAKSRPRELERPASAPRLKVPRPPEENERCWPGSGRAPNARRWPPELACGAPWGGPLGRRVSTKVRSFARRGAVGGRSPSRAGESERGAAKERCGLDWSGLSERLCWGLRSALSLGRSERESEIGPGRDDSGRRGGDECTFYELGLRHCARRQRPLLAHRKRQEGVALPLQRSGAVTESIRPICLTPALRPAPRKRRDAWGAR